MSEPPTVALQPPEIGGDFAVDLDQPLPSRPGSREHLMDLQQAMARAVGEGRDDRDCRCGHQPPDDKRVSSNPAPDVLSDRDRQLIVLGYITAVAIPPIGVILGIVIAIRRRTLSRHGAVIIVLSIIASVIWFLLLSSGVISSTSTQGNY